jgi:hypothetical protein
MPVIAAIAMSEQRVIMVKCAWSAVVIFLALLYLTGEYVKPLVIAGFVFGSSLLGIGRPWLFFACFIAALAAIAVALGVPGPAQWPAITRRLLELLGTAADLRAAVVGLISQSSSTSNIAAQGM